MNKSMDVRDYSKFPVERDITSLRRSREMVKQFAAGTFNLPREQDWVKIRDWVKVP